MQNNYYRSPHDQSGTSASNTRNKLFDQNSPGNVGVNAPQNNIYNRTPGAGGVGVSPTGWPFGTTQSSPNKEAMPDAPKAVTSGLNPMPTGVPNETVAGDIRSRAIIKGLTSEDPRVASQRIQNQRRASAREYAARLAAKEMAASQGFQPGTAQASRLMKEQLSPAYKANLADTSNTNEQQRQYFQEYLGMAKEQEDMTQTRKDIEWTRQNTNKVQDEASAQMYLNGITDPKTKEYLTGIFASQGLGALRQAMADPEALPHSQTPLQDEMDSVKEVLKLKYPMMDGESEQQWLSMKPAEGEGKTIQQMLHEQVADRYDLAYKPVDEGKKSAEQTAALERISADIDNATPEDVLKAYPTPLSLSSLSEYDGYPYDTASFHENHPGGWVNLGGHAVRVIDDYKVTDPGGRGKQYNIIEYNGKVYSFSEGNKNEWIKGNVRAGEMDYDSDLRYTAPWDRKGEK